MIYHLTNKSKAGFIVTLLFCFVLPFQLFGNESDKTLSQKDRDYLVGFFVEQGFDEEFLVPIFFDKRLVKLPVVINKNVNNKENRRNYEDFYSAYSMKMAHRFIRKWKSVLNNASKQFEVDEEVLVAILLIETGLGNVLGQYPVISVFTSLIVENHNKQLEYKNVKPIGSEEQYVIDRLLFKSEWAKVELAALLAIIEQSNHSPFRFKGSFAGAFGIPQFLPSSYLQWGYDSDKNGSVNLFLFPDAIYSTANYLRAHGWKKGLYLESNKDVIYKYNRSHIYVETVLNVAKKIQTYHKSNAKKEIEQTNLVQDYSQQHQKSSS